MTLTPKILIKALLKLDRNNKLLFGTQDIAKWWIQYVLFVVSITPVPWFFAQKKSLGNIIKKLSSEYWSDVLKSRAGA